ncbi:tetratricopeptide repeat protein [Runella sp.]|uniref:tetratricopeptide repeat protein n=1 Tax=Runella sp. TaxID=1960881 RepID=UPI003D0B2C8F
MKKTINFLLVCLFWSAVGIHSVQAQDIQAALVRLERGQVEKAGQLLQELHQAHPTAQTYFYNGYHAIRTNQLKQAGLFFEKGIALDEKRHPLNKAGLGIVALLEGRTADAERILEEVMKESKGKDSEILGRIGEAYTGYTQVINDTDKPLYQHHNAAKAIEYLEQAIKRDKKNGQLWLALGDARALSTPANGGPAVTAYEYALELLPDKSLPNHRIGTIYWAGRSYNLAGDFYKAAIKADSLYAPSYLQLAELNFKTNRYKEAAAHMNRYLALVEKPDAELRYRSGQFDYLAREYSRAVQKIEQVKNEIETPVKYRLLGRSYFSLKDYDKTIENLKTFLEKSPDKAEGLEYKLLGRAYQNITDTTIAKDSIVVFYLAKAATTDTAENLYSEIAEMSYKLKNYEDVVKYVEAGEKRFNKSSVKDKFWLAMAAYKMGREDSTMYLKADSAFAAVQESSPDHLPTILYRAKSNYYGYANQDTAYVKSVPFYERFVELAYTKKEEKKFKYDMKIALKYLYSYYTSVEIDPEKALDLAEKGKELDPADKDFNDMMAQLNNRPPKPNLSKPQ